MLLLKATWVLLGMILFMSGARGKERRMCVLKGSSVNLTCIAESFPAAKEWYTIKNENLRELSANGDVTYNVSKDGTLTIRGVQNSDSNSYCCKESSSIAAQCLTNRMELHVADLEVKVFPAPEGQKVTLMCSTSCPLTESPAAFIWYKNREVLYEDWSHWYQELLSSDQAARYSCAIKGYEHLRAPEVSVAFIKPDCFGVTYPEPEECPQKLKSANEPCSIMYPREVHVDVKSEKDYATLTCKTSCPVADSQTLFSWYWNRNVLKDCASQYITVFKSFPHISCGVKNNEYLQSHEACDGIQCMIINYASRRLCMLEGSSVNITSKYLKPSIFQNSSEWWYKLKRNMKKKADVTAIEAGGRVEHHRLNENQHILTISDLRKNDSGEYMFSLQRYETYEQQDLQGVILVVTGLKVTMLPSDVVTEGQRVTLTCSTSCPLTESTTYIWFFNEQPLSLTGVHNKHLILNPVRRLHAGNYSCAVRTPQSVSSALVALTVKVYKKAESINPGEKTVAIMNIIKVVFLLLGPFVGCNLYLILRKRQIVTPATKRSETAETEELTTHNEKITRMGRTLQGEQEEEEQEDAV